VLRQRGDELGQHVLGRDDAVAAVLELVPHRARGVEDELDVDGLLGLREGRAEQAERQEGALQDVERSGHRSPLHGAADRPLACRPRTLRQTRGRASWPNPPVRERVCRPTAAPGRPQANPPVREHVPGGAPAEPRAARDARPQEASYALRRRRLSMSSRTRRPVSQWRFSIAVATRRRGTGVGFPSSPSATKFRWPIVHSLRSPVSGFSPCTSQRTIMLVVPVHATRLLTSAISPTWIGARKSIGSVAAVTTTLRQKRVQATAALTSMSCSSRPPKTEPTGFVWLGKIVSTVMTQSDTTCSSGAESIGAA